jgi:hypothetical protein
MTQSDRPSEDILGLFQKFDGDAHVYKEFAAPVAAPVPARNGTSLNGSHPEVHVADVPEAISIAPPAGPAAEPIAPPAPVAPVAPVAPIAALAPVAPLSAAPSIAHRSPMPPAAAPEAAVPQPAAARHAPPATELERLFIRLAESTQSSAGPMARWRVGLK